MVEEPETSEESLKGFLARYGERGYYLLKAILEASLRASGAKLGDFDLRTLKAVLQDYGLDYNPVPLLYTLERRLKVIRTTYRSSQQHWWEIANKREVEEALAEFDGREAAGLNDYELKLLRVQFYSLEPEKVLRALKTAEREGDKAQVARLAFTVLPRLVKFLKVARSRYSSELSAEIRVAEEVLELAERVALRGRSEPKEVVTEAEVYEDSLR